MSIDAAPSMVSPLQEKVRIRQSRVYGLSGVDLAKLCSRIPALLEPINETGDAIAAEVVYAFENELATTLTDCLMRRMMLGLDRDLGMSAAERVARVAQTHLGWSEDRVLKELSAYRSYVDRFEIGS